jgi:hypothetical protein
LRLAFAVPNAAEFVPHHLDKPLLVLDLRALFAIFILKVGKFLLCILYLDASLGGLLFLVEIGLYMRLVVPLLLLEENHPSTDLFEMQGLLFDLLFAGLSLLFEPQ